MDLKTVYADEQGNIVDAPKDFIPLIRQGQDFVEVSLENLIPLPKVADLMCLPDHKPMAQYQGEVLPITGHTVCAILPSGYVNTGLPAYEVESGAEPLPPYPYAPVVAYKDELYVMAEKLESSYTNPFQQYNTRNLHKLVASAQKQFPQNKLVSFLGDLALNDKLYTAQDFFYQRGEVVLPLGKNPLPIPNLQGAYYPLMEPLNFNPSGAELAQVATAHLAKNNLITFGMDPREDLANAENRLLNAVTKIRSRTKLGKLNLFTNGLAGESLAALQPYFDTITIYLPCCGADYNTVTTMDFAKVINSLNTLQDFAGKIILNVPYISGYTNQVENCQALLALVKEYKIAGILLTNPWLPQQLLINLMPATGNLLSIKDYLSQLNDCCPVAGDILSLMPKEN